MKQFWKTLAFPFVKIGEAFRKMFHTVFASVIFVQLRDKIDMSWMHTTRSKIRTIVFSILKFAIVAGIVFGLIFILNLLSVIDTNTVVPIFTMFFTIMMVLMLLSDSVGLMKSLYYADHNKVLVTWPITSSKLFLSKLIVYFLFDLKKSLELLVPAMIGFFAFLIMKGTLTPLILLWMWPVLVITLSFIVLFASLLSIPFLYIFQLTRKFPILELIFIILATAAGIFLIVKVIGFIPEDIDMVNEWKQMLWNFEKFVKGKFKNIFYPFVFAAETFIGALKLDATGFSHYFVTGNTALHLLIIFGCANVLAVIAFFGLKKFYFSMMSKTFEFDKNILDFEKENKVHRKYVTFVNKEMKLTFRNFEVSGTYVIVYILTPLLLYLLDTIFSAISTKLEGNIMTYAFNILLICLPYLSSNASIATLYSKEGRAAYIKKTKPINPLFPLASKVFLNFLLAIPSIIACGFIFGNFASDIGVLPPIAIAISILFIQYGHICYSISLDIMNPQNEIYATEGELLNNKNETNSTIVGFLTSILFALFMYFLLSESLKSYGSYNSAFVRMMIVAIIYGVGNISLFVLKVKGFYYEK